MAPSIDGRQTPVCGDTRPSMGRAISYTGRKPGRTVRRQTLLTDAPSRAILRWYRPVDRPAVVIRNHNSIPMFVQISDTLRQQIERGAFQVGDVIPSEREYATQLRVSRMTVRAA